MQKRISNIPFSGTKEQEAQLFEIIEKHKNEPGAIMPVLQEAQNVYGYLPIEVQQMVADGLGVPLSEVFGVATFYSQFSLTPKGKYNISVCLGTACYVKGSGKILEELSKELGIEAEECTEDGKFSLTACRCIGACGLAPVITINDVVYGRLVPEDVMGSLGKYEDSHAGAVADCNGYRPELPVGRGFPDADCCGGKQRGGHPDAEDHRQRQGNDRRAGGSRDGSVFHNPHHPKGGAGSAAF